MDKVELKNIFGYDTPDDSTAYLIVRISNLHQRRLNAKLSGLGLTFTQYVILYGTYWLLYQGQEVTQVTLGYLVKFDKSTVSSVVKTLITKKLVKRKEHPTDTRAKILSLTTNGVVLIEKACEVVKQVDKEIFGENENNLTEMNKELLKILRAYNE